MDASLQFAMRELRALLAAPRLWAGLGGASLLLGMVGPFGTYDQLPLGARIAYWAAIAVATYLTGFVVVHFCVRFLFGSALAGMSGFALAGAIAGVPVAGVVTLINRLAFADASIFGFVAILPYGVVASALVSAIVTFFAREEAADAASAPQSRIPPARPRILDRLPVEKRGRLSHLTMQDHYVEVHTDRGSALVLMRMGDAIVETDGIDGLRIHRSHWVARNAVDRLERRNGRLVLHMRDGAELPVSRSYSDAVRAAGFG